MVYDKRYDTILKEHFDLDDRETLKIMTSINESDASKVLEGLTSKLYQVIIDKVDDIDYGLIPASKGDITKVDGIERVIESLNIMVGIMVQSRQEPSIIQNVIDCIKNIQTRTDLLVKAHALNLEIPITIYNTMVLTIISATTYLIDTCIDFIKDPGADSYEAVVRRNNIARSKDALVLKNITKFNATCKNGELDRVLEYLIKAKAKGFTGMTAITSVTVLAGLILSIIPIMRELIYLYYHARVTVDDYLSVQADLLQMNIAGLELNDSIPQEQKAKIVQKQTKIVEKLRKAANTIAIKEKKAENKTFNTINSENRLYRFNEIQDELPNSADSLF